MRGAVFIVRLLTAASLLAVMPLSHAISGKEAYEELMKVEKEYNDKALVDYINEIGNRLLQANGITDKYTFTLIDDENLNAFAHKGNYVYVHRGLLAYVNNEAQLASVIGHEIAHVTEGHVTDARSQSIAAELLSIVAAVASGSGDVYEAGKLWSASMMQSHGRDNELEADSVGSEYMAKAGYDPREVVEMLSTLKNHEIHLKKIARDKGAGKQTYHGLFATHPRNDARLRGVVENAAKIATNEHSYKGEDRFRELTNGLIWGPNFVAKDIKPNMYLSMAQRIRVTFAEEWVTQDTSHQPGDTLMVATAPEQAAAMTLKVQRRTVQSPEEYIYNTLKMPPLSNGREFEPAGLPAYTGTYKNSAGKTIRIGVVYYKLDAYIFSGEVKDEKDQKAYAELDKQMLQAMASFRTITQREIEGLTPQRLKYVKATSATRFDALAKQLKLGRYGEDELRLINGYYPNGEPKPGEWIKIIVK